MMARTFLVVVIGAALLVGPAGWGGIIIGVTAFYAHEKWLKSKNK